MRSFKKMVIVVTLIMIVLTVGWVKNLIKLINCDFASPYKCEVVHALGIVPPVGAITGWMYVGK